MPYSAGYVVHPQVLSPEREMEYLRKVADLSILLLFPKQYSACKITRKLMRQVLSKYVLLPLIEVVTDPNYINRYQYSRDGQEWLFGFNINIKNLEIP